MSNSITLVPRAVPGKAAGGAPLDEVLRRVTALSKKSPEEIMELASGNDPEGFLDIDVEIEGDGEELLRPWSEMKRASPAPLTDRQYQAFLRGDDIPAEHLVVEPTEGRRATRLLSYSAAVLLFALGIEATYAAVLAISHRVNTLADFAITGLPIIATATLTVVSLVAQMRLARELKRPRRNQVDGAGESSHERPAT